MQYYLQMERFSEKCSSKTTYLQLEGSAAQHFLIGKSTCVILYFTIDAIQLLNFYLEFDHSGDVLFM